MNESTLIHQLKAVDNACRGLQAQVAGTKAAGVLICVRTLLVKLILDHTLAAQLEDQARQTFTTLSADISALSSMTKVEGASLGSTLSDFVQQLQALETPMAEALVIQLLAIEAESLRSFDDAFNAASAGGWEATMQKMESFSTAALADYLAANVFMVSTIVVESIQVISGGYSKQTLRVRLGSTDVAPTSLVLRMDRRESQKFVGTWVADEYPIMRALYEGGVRVPKPYALEASGTVLGAPLMVLGDVAGRTIGSLFDFPPPNRELGRELAVQLALIHAMSESTVGATAITSTADTVAAVRLEVEGLQAAWKAMGLASAIVEAAFFVVIRNLHLAAGRRCFIHGDFGLHNILVDQNSITAVLDWEFARVGSPANDFGWFYDTADHLLGMDVFLSDYAEAGGTAPPREEIHFYRLWGALRFAVICCQVDAGFNAGHLKEIDYAVPGNRVFRLQQLRIAEALKTFQSTPT